MDGDHCGNNLWNALQIGTNYKDAEFLINGIDVYCLDDACSKNSHGKRARDFSS